MHKCSFGCGTIQKDGWANVDREDLGQEYIFDSSELPTDCFDMIVSHCSLQMNDYHSIISVLKDLHRSLKNGGVLRISLPDIVRGFENYNKGNILFFPNGEENISVRFSAWLTWYSTTKTLLTQEALRLFLLDAGFNVVSDADYNKTVLSTGEITELDTRQNECYFIEAKK